ncbi:MAG: pyridoxamine 5'-phosphate oxidase [Bacteroidales bacterium]|nr:pyridoxamine 5'-phosphate oxidase [Bacteroidales bacterium]
MSHLDLHSIRREYSSRSLGRTDLPADPIAFLEQWVGEAIAAKATEPTALLVATATAQGYPSLRTVLLKEVYQGRLVFYTNYDSRKGQQIAENPHIACSMVWHELERQIHVEGVAERIPEAMSDAYFAERPYKSRVGARISPQSKPIPSREYIMGQFVVESAKFLGRRVPRPAHWGGYWVKPTRIEFWQGRDSRLHDRFVYTLQADGSWTIERVAP